MLLTAVLIVSVLTGYIFWIRPLLKQRPSLAHFWEKEESLLRAIRLKLIGLKERLTAAVVTIAGGAVWLHDLIAPMLDGVDTSRITANIPQWAIPLLPVGVALLMMFFRWLSDRRKKQADAAALESGLGVT